MATASFDIRYIPEEFKGKNFIQGKKILEKKIKNIVGDLGKIEILLFEPPQFTKENNQFVLSLKKSAKKIIGEDPKIIVKHGGSDIRHYNQVNCDGVTFGPIGANLHADNEWVDIKSLEKYYLILKDFLSKM
ncbi:MAG: M20/M25/M40 family metallo-hydrolase [Patescibacteria group bacterium]|nr:M20/M25/M40 family metallo-hydrolase [Patescibacteria group bacterium]